MTKLSYYASLLLVLAVASANPAHTSKNLPCPHTFCVFVAWLYWTPAFQPLSISLMKYLNLSHQRAETMDHQPLAAQSILLCLQILVLLLPLALLLTAWSRL